MAEGGYADAACKINRVLHKLKDYSAELNEVERIVAELKSDAHGSSVDSEKRSDLLFVAGTVRDMLNVLKIGLGGILAKQKMQVAIQEITSTEYCASDDDSTRLKRVKPSTRVESNYLCGNPSTETRVATTSAWNGPEICTHTCIHHPLVVNPRLPMPRIIGLRECSVTWSALSDSSSFKGAFAEANPKLFGLLGWDK